MYKVSDCNHTPNFGNASTQAQQRAIQKVSINFLLSFLTLSNFFLHNHYFLFIALQRQVYTRYYACGPNKRDYDIYHIERSEATKQAQEASQDISLLDVSSASSSARSQQIQDASTYSNLAYRFNSQPQKYTPVLGKFCSVVLIFIMIWEIKTHGWTLIFYYRYG